MKPLDPSVKLAEQEKTMLDFWQSEKIFEKSNAARDGKMQRYSFYDGPPFANGLPHYGHLLANTIKDIVPRYWNMRGYKVERRFGWDCHGLPVEFEIEKTHNLKGRGDILAMGVDKFNELCRASVLHYTKEWQKTITRLGRWVDWDNQYRTMDLSFMESVWWGFSQLFEKGLCYQGYKVVPYSPRITAVLSNFEANQNYNDVQDPAITVKFKLKKEDAYLLAWTTTPWTLISNLALSAGDDVVYVKIRDLKTGECYYLAKERLDAVYKKKKGDKEEAYEILEELAASKLIGQEYEPLFPYFAAQKNAFRVLSGDFVTTDAGTGIVHCAPAYGEDDHFVCHKNDIELVDPLDEEAKFTGAIKEYEGLYIKDADKEIIKHLKESGKLLRHETIVHSYPFCERTGEPLIYRAIPAWFVKVEQFRDQLVENNDKIRWVPEHLKKGRMGKWLENARDWAISRNRFWGTPIPIWRCDKHPDHLEVMSSRDMLVEKTGQQVNDLHKHFVDELTFKCSQCEGTMKRILDVFDCWFESGSMPFAQLHYPFENKEVFEESFPADFIAEGLDQTRGWFYTLSVLSEAIFGSHAFKNVVVNGLVLAKDGRKMSKRWKNYTPPEELIDQYGADGVRLYMLNSAILRGEDLKFTDAGVKDIIRAVLLPLWNAHSFLATYADADNWQPSSDLLSGKIEVSSTLDKWLLSRFQFLVDGVNREMEDYKLYNVVPEILNFVLDLTNWYIRLNRRRFWVGSKVMSEDTKDAYKTLYYVLLQFSKVLAPFAPFISEAIYQNLTEGLKDAPSSVHLTDMPQSESHLKDESLEKGMNLARRVTELGRSLRAKHQIKTRQVLSSMLVITKNEKESEFLAHMEDVIASELNVKNLEFSMDELSYVNLTVKPNLRTLGKRLGKSLGAFRNHLSEENKDQKKVQAMLEAIEEKGSITFEGQQIELSDLLFERTAKGERLVASDLGVTVLLDTKLTQDLIDEGLARELVNRIQNFRKDMELKVTDRIHLHLRGAAPIVTATKAFEAYVAREVLANGFSYLKDEGAVENFQFAKDFDINGDKIFLGMDVLS